MTNILTTYSDKTGELNSEISNNGSQLKLKIEGVEFVSNTLDDFEQVNPKNKKDRFEFDSNGILTNYVLSVKIPIKFEIENIEKETTLDCKLISKLSDRGYNETSATCRTLINNEIIEIDNFDLFESLFDRLNSRLDSAIKLKSCFNCLYSDYSVYGQGFWGTMLCFKNIKSEYLKVKDKDEFMEIMDNHHQLVQETFLCNEFERRKKGTGYRG